MAQECIKTHKTRFQEKKDITYAITLKDTGEIIGTISLMDISERSKHARIGFWIGVQYWNKEYYRGGKRTTGLWLHG